MSPLSARTSPAAETAESTHHASRHLHDAPSFTPSVRLMKTQTATEWGRCLQWLWGTVTLPEKFNAIAGLAKGDILVVRGDDV